MKDNLKEDKEKQAFDEETGSSRIAVKLIRNWIQKRMNPKTKNAIEMLIELK